MRIAATITLALLATAPAAGPAGAAAPPLSLFEQFQAICLKTDGRPDNALAQARALGYAMEPDKDLAPGSLAWTGERMVGAQAFTVFVHSDPKRLPDVATDYLQFSCAVMVTGQAGEDAAAARAWIGLPADGPERDGAVTYTYRQTAAGRDALDLDATSGPAADERREASLSGNYRRLVIRNQNDMSGLMFFNMVVK